MTRSLDDWLQVLERQHPRSIDLGLKRCGRVYRQLGAPSLAARTWTVAGTNGKGSVTAYLSAMATAAGLSVGTYTSPHILRFNERIRIDGVAADDADIVNALQRVEDARGDISLTYFEFTTLAAFLLFSDRQLDSVVLEVGLGGRLDAVNLVDADCAVITPIGLDHSEYLGNDRDSIAIEKAGIVRAAKPVVVGDRNPPESLVRKVREVGSKPLYLGQDFDITHDHGLARYFGPGIDKLELGKPPLSGEHQWDNLATALAAFAALVDPIGVDSEWMQQALSDVRLAGRLQHWAGDKRVLLDVGHNPMAAEVVERFLQQNSDSGHTNVCVLGMLSDKDVERVVRILSPHIQHWYCAGLGGQRGQSGAKLAGRVHSQLPSAMITDFPTVELALHKAMRAVDDKTRILVFGSFQTVADAIRALESQGHEPGQYW